MPIDTDIPTEVSRFIFRNNPTSKSIAFVPNLKPNLKVESLESRRAMKPATPVLRGPTETSNFHEVLFFTLCAPS